MAYRGKIDPRKGRRYGQTHTISRMIENAVAAAPQVVGVGFSASYGQVGSDTEQVSTHNILDSSYHPDSTTASVLRGALIVGQGVSPTWSLLAAPGVTGAFLRFDGTDTLWSSWALPASGGTNAQFLRGDGTWQTPAGATNYWSRSGSSVTLANAGDDVEFNNGEILSFESTADGTRWYSYLTGDSFARFDFSASGLMRWGDGTVLGDVVLERTAANVLELADGDTFSAETLRGREQLALELMAAGNVPASGEGFFWAKSDGALIWTVDTGGGAASATVAFISDLPTPDAFTVKATSVDSTADYLSGKLTGSGLASISTVGGSGTNQKTNIDVPAYTEGNGIDITGTAITALATASDGMVITCAGAGAANVYSTTSPWTTIWKTANEDRTNTTTVSADSTLTFTGVAGGIYVVRGRIFYQSTAAADFKFSILTAQTYQNAMSVVKDVKPDALGTLATTSKGWTTSPNGLPTDISRTWTLGTNGGYVEFECVIKCHASVNGAISWGFAQGTSHLTDKATTLAGSYIEYRRIA